MPALVGPLLEQLRHDADIDIAARLADAGAEAERIRDAAAAQRERRRTTVVAAHDRELARARETARDEVARGTLRDVLVAREAFLDRVFAQTARCLDGVAAMPDFARRLDPILAEALPFLPDEDARARCAEPIVSVVCAALRAQGRADVNVVPDDTVPAGALLENATGTIRVDATLAARMRRMRAVLSIEAVRLAEESPP